MKYLFLILYPFVSRIVSGTSNFNLFDDSILYKINWPGKAGYASIDLPSDEGIVVTTHQKEKYRCILPKIKEKEKAGDEEYAGPNAFELLLPLFQIGTCSSRLEAYWTYEICHGKYVKQYHEERDGKKVLLQEYFLGRWDKFMSANLNEELEQMKQSGQSFNPPIKKFDGMNLPYLQLNFTDGTVCDLNGKPRVANVLYVCYTHGKNEIYSIKEISTCVYEVIVLTALLCQHPKYRPQETGEHDINCLPLEGTPNKPLSLLQLEAESLKQRHSKPFGGGKTDRFSVSIQEFRDKDGRKQVKVELVPLEEEDLVEADLEPRRIEEGNLEAGSSQTLQGGGAGASPEQPLPHTLPIPVPVQEFLSGKDCLRGGSGWWKFKFCYGYYVQQYHVEKNPDGTVQKSEISLGVFDKDAHIDWIKRNPHKRPKPLESRKYFSHYYGGGSLCEKTGKPRETEVKLICVDKKGSLTLYLLEPHTCQYELGVESPLICELLDRLDEYGLVMSTNQVHETPIKKFEENQVEFTLQAEGP